MHRQSIFVGTPNMLVMTLAGAVATILATALLYVAPVLGLAVVNVPLLVGALFFADAELAFGFGYALFFIGGWLALPIALKLAWNTLPGGTISLAGAALKGLLLGVAAWPASGLLVWLLSALARVPALEGVGPFALGLGWAAAAWFLIVHLAYGLALAVVAAMPRGLSPIDALGWVNHGAGGQA